MQLINKFLDFLKQIELTSLIIFTCFLVYLSSFIIVSFETKQMTNQLTNSSNMPEWKSKFLKEKIRINTNIISEEKGKMWGFSTSFILIKTRNTIRKKIKNRKK